MADVLSVGAWLLRAAILGALLVGIRRRDVSVATNALVAFAVTFLPTFVEVALYASRGVPVSVDSIVPFWIATAGFLHVLGMLGWYESTGWWDHVTHVVSSAFVAAVVFGSLHGIALGSPDVELGDGFVVGLTLLFTLAVGVLWELLELVVHRYGGRLGVEPVLVPYGRRDAALDLVFDGVGVLLVAGLDVRTFVPVAAQVPSLAGWFLVATGGLVVVGSVASALVLGPW